MELDNKTDDLILKELHNTLKVLYLSNAMKVEEFFTIPKEDIVFEILEDEQIIADFVNTFKISNEENINNLNKMNDSSEIPVVNINVTLKDLKNVYTFLLQQDNINECMKLVNTIKKFIKKK